MTSIPTLSDLGIGGDFTEEEMKELQDIINNKTLSQANQIRQLHSLIEKLEKEAREYRVVGDFTDKQLNTLKLIMNQNDKSIKIRKQEAYKLGDVYNKDNETYKVMIESYLTDECKQRAKGIFEPNSQKLSELCDSITDKNSQELRDKINEWYHSQINRTIIQLDRKLMETTDLSLPAIHVCITDNSGQHLSATLSALKTIFKNHPVDIKTISSESGVPIQPKDGEIMEGAYNRIINAINKNPKLNDYIMISFESGLIKLINQDPPTYADIGVVYIKYKDTIEKHDYHSTDTTNVPEEYVKQIKEGEKIGYVYNQRHKYDPIDWQAHVRKDCKPGFMLFKETIISAIINNQAIKEGILKSSRKIELYNKETVTQAEQVWQEVFNALNSNTNNPVVRIYSLQAFGELMKKVNKEATEKKTDEKDTVTKE